jgi:biopolymer transport protein ExbD
MSNAQKQEEVIMRRRPTFPTSEEPNLIPVMNLVCLLIPFMLLTATFIQYAVIHVSAPRIPPVDHATVADVSLDLTVLVTDQGFRISAHGRPVVEGRDMDASEPGHPTIPLAREEVGGGYDYASLTRELRHIKDGNEGESQIRIGAERNIDYATVVRVMDATREDARGELFPDVILVAGVI